MSTQRTLTTLPADMITPVGAYLRLREALGAAGVPARVRRARRAGRPLLVPRRRRSDHVQPRGGGRVPAVAARPAARRAAVRRRRRRLPELRLGDAARAGAAAARATSDDAGIPEMQFMLASCVVAFDHVRRTMSVIGPADEADRAWRRSAAPLGAPAGRAARRRARPRRRDRAASATWTRSAEAKEHIAAGDAFQIVLSQRVRRSTGVSPFAIYRALRAVNPSPYMFLLDLGGLPPGRVVARRRTSGSTWTAPASCGRSPAPGRAAPTASRTTCLPRS